MHPLSERYCCYFLLIWRKIKTTFGQNRAIESLVESRSTRLDQFEKFSKCKQFFIKFVTRQAQVFGKRPYFLQFKPINLKNYTTSFLKCFMGRVSTLVWTRCLIVLFDCWWHPYTRSENLSITGAHFHFTDRYLKSKTKWRSVGK